MCSCQDLPDDGHRVVNVQRIVAAGLLELSSSTLIPSAETREALRRRAEELEATG